MRIENEVLLDYSDVLIRPKRSTLTSRKEVNLVRDYTFKHSGHWSGIPIMASNMDGVGTFEMAEALAKKDMFTCLHKYYPKHDLRNWIDEKGSKICMNWAYSMGISDEDFIKFDAVYSGLESHELLFFVNIDVANGYTQKFVDFIKQFRDLYPNITIIAGNVATGEMTEELILSGADIVKVGIGPGSVCTTRIKTGVGIPQLSSVIECADSAHGLRGHIIADGGCTTSGDVAKAFGAGADFVMLGGMLAGHDEGGLATEKSWEVDRTGDIVHYEIHNKTIYFHGSSSEKAQLKHKGKINEYAASEGKEVTIPYRGPVENTVKDILGGLRSTCTYVGAASLKELTKRTTFVRVSNTHNNIYGEE